MRVAIEEQVLEIAREIFEDEGVAVLLESLDEAEFGERTAEQEKKDYTRRVKQAKAASSVTYKNVELREPQRELGVVAMLAQLLSTLPELFPFHVLDWNNAAGFDLLARDVTDLSFDDAAKFYVECKQLLTGFVQPLSEQRTVYRLLGHRSGKRRDRHCNRWRHPEDGY